MGSRHARHDSRRARHRAPTNHSKLVIGGLVIVLVAALAALVPVVGRIVRPGGKAVLNTAKEPAGDRTPASTGPAPRSNQPLAALSPTASNRWIVALNDSAGDPRPVAREYEQRHGAKLSMLFASTLHGFAGKVPAAGVAALREDPRVASVVPDAEVVGYAQTMPKGLDRIDGERSPTRSGNGTGSVDVDVALIDTGVDRDNPELKVAGGVDCTGGDDDTDANGHGTHVAGTIAARDDGKGMVGVAPGARLWSVTALTDQGRGSVSSAICAVDWVTAHAKSVEVATMSVGGRALVDPAQPCGRDDPLHDAICRAVKAGVTFVVAAGNSATDAGRFSPAGYKEVITVSAVADSDGKPGGEGSATCRDGGSDDTMARFANRGNTVDLVAPGTCVVSTAPGGKLATRSGTSMASSYVAGAAALVKARDRDASPAAVRAALLRTGTTDSRRPGVPPLVNAGRLPGGLGQEKPPTPKQADKPGSSPPGGGSSSAAGGGAPGGGSVTSRLATDLFNRANAERRARGLAPLRWDSGLANLASDWSGQMARTGDFNHRPDLGGVLQSRFGGRLNRIGENIAFISGGSEYGRQLHTMWMKSDGHRENILQPGFDRLGVGVTCIGGKVYATQNFGGTPSAPASSESLPPQNPIVATQASGLAC